MFHSFLKSIELVIFKHIYLEGLDMAINASYFNIVKRKLKSFEKLTCDCCPVSVLSFPLILSKMERLTCTDVCDLLRIIERTIVNTVCPAVH